MSPWQRHNYIIGVYLGLELGIDSEWRVPAVSDALMATFSLHRLERGTLVGAYKSW